VVALPQVLFFVLLMKNVELPFGNATANRSEIIGSHSGALQFAFTVHTDR